jgi:hypothetical protein
VVFSGLVTSLKSLFSICYGFPKVDVAGSSPVSRSMVSKIYRESAPREFILNGITLTSPFCNPFLEKELID